MKDGMVSLTFNQMFGFVKSFQIFIRLHLADCHWFAETKAMCNLCIYSLPVWLSMTKWKRTFETLFVLYTTVAHSRIQAISYTDQSSDPARERYPITSYKSKCILIFQWINLKMFFFFFISTWNGLMRSQLRLPTPCLRHSRNKWLRWYLHITESEKANDRTYFVWCLLSEEYIVTFVMYQKGTNKRLVTIYFNWLLSYTTFFPIRKAKLYKTNDFTSI